MDAARTLEKETAEIAAEAPAHEGALERMLDRAFGPGRFAKTSERVREAGARHRFDLSRVALHEGAPIGCCRLYDVDVGARPALFLGPLAVDPARQHAGLGARLVAAALAASRSEGKTVLVVGAHAFFAPFGFSHAPVGGVRMPGPVDPQRFMGFDQAMGRYEPLAGAVTAPRAASRS